MKALYQNIARVFTAINCAAQGTSVDIDQNQGKWFRDYIGS